MLICISDKIRILYMKIVSSWCTCLDGVPSQSTEFHNSAQHQIFEYFASEVRILCTQGGLRVDQLSYDRITHCFNVLIKQSDPPCRSSSKSVVNCLANRPDCHSWADPRERKLRGRYAGKTRCPTKSQDHGELLMVFFLGKYFEHQTCYEKVVVILFTFSSLYCHYSQ